MKPHDAFTRLALEGGPPTFAEGPPTWPRRDAGVEAALSAAYLDGCWGRYHGGYVQQLETRLADLHQTAWSFACCSGTFAVELALRSRGITSGDEVILAGYDFPGNFRAIEATGARPVLVDIDPGNWCLNPDLLATAVTPRTRAVIVSHLHGGLADMARLAEFAHQQRIPIIEDACQAVGARVQGRLAATWGQLGVLSFGGSKLLTAGRGGALVMSDQEDHQRAKIFCERGNHAYPLSELQAAVLLPQLDHLEQRNQTRRQRVQQLLQLTDDIDDIRPLVMRQQDEPSFYKLAWLLSEQLAPQRTQLAAAARAEGIALDPGFRGFTRRSSRRCGHSGQLDHSRRAASATILLHHPVLLESEEWIERLAAGLRKIVQYFR